MNLKEHKKVFYQWSFYMKVSVIFLSLFLSVAGVALATRSNAQVDLHKPISLHLTNTPLTETLTELENRARVQIVMVGNISTAKKFNIDVRNETLGTVLKKLFEPAFLTFKVMNNTIVITSIPLPPQPGRITGKVIDERGEPLPGASIKIVENGQAMQSRTDGGYQLSLNPGTYTMEVSFIGYQTRRITGIKVTERNNTPLDIVLNPDAKSLSAVVITSSFSKASTEGLYARQKNEAGISNGMSREQIAALPDKNIGETLKRISGISTNDNRRVVVRGIAERYNLAMMDGAILPSTDVQVRDFEFDIVPSNLIDNVVISKTATPDMSFGFGGGLVQINTFAIPNENFNTFNLGSKYTNGSTGKDFLGYGRGRQDYLGFDDGGRDHFPKDLLIFTHANYKPTDPYANLGEGVSAITPAMIAEQNKKIGGLERMGTRTYTARPGQNYQFSLGRNYNLKDSRFGFVGSLSYRNEQTIDDIPHFGRGSWEKPGNRSYFETGEEQMPTFSNQYNFNTTWGALLNMGWSSTNHKVTFRNFYSRVFSNQFSRIVGFGNETMNSDPDIKEYDRPKFIDLLQNRINGEHTFGAFHFDWNLSRNRLSNLEEDAVEAWLFPITSLNGTVYNVEPSAITNPGTGTFNRSKYHYIETNRIAEGALSYVFKFAGQKQTIKTGYQYMHRSGTYDWTVLPIGSVQTVGDVYPYVPVQEWGRYLEFKDPLRDLLYFPASFSQNGYEGKNINQAYYGMMDNRFTNWLRLVWGVRGEYYKYERLKSGANDMATDQQITLGDKLQFVDPETGKLVRPNADPRIDEKAWHYLPSFSLTATPLKDFNIRAAYSKSIVRPALIENSQMIRFDPAISAIRRNEGVLSTLIDHYDFRLEWYPKAGEVISVGYFRKYFDKPVELYRTDFNVSTQVSLVTKNSDWAKVSGWEFDLRKSLGFINSEWNFLDNIFFNGNLTLQQSEVQASLFQGVSMTEDKYGKNYEYRTKVLQKEKRPLYGQVPVVYNAGLQYIGERFGANVTFNHMGYKTFTTGLRPDIVEYERPRNQLDAQLSYSFRKDKKLNLKLNMTNLLNSPYRFFINDRETYKLQDRWKGMTYLEIYQQTENWSDIYEWKYGFSEKYEEGYYESKTEGTKTRVGDRDTFIRKVGSSFSLSLSYSF